MALQQVGQACPLLPLQGVAGLACMIVQAVQDIRNQRRSCEGLAEKAVKMVLAMSEELAHGGFNADMRKRIAAFSEELKRILTSILPYTHYKWHRHLLEKTSINNVISEASAGLDECARNFQFVGMLDLHKMLEKAARTREETNNYEQAILSRQEDIATTVRSLDMAVREMSTMVQPVVEETAVFTQTDLQWESCIDQTLGRPCFRLCTAVLVNRIGQPRVLVKCYPSEYDERLFLKDLARMSRLRHPNVPNLIGRSVRQAAAPFAVFSELTPIHLRDMFLRSMERSPAEGFMFALSVMQGISSALYHMSSDLNVGTKDLEACMKIGNLALSRSGKVVVGHGLLLSGPSTSYSLDLSRWLILRFWNLTNEVLYGSPDPINDQDWDSMQSTLDKHIQPLPTLVAYDCPDFPFITRRLTSILNPLDALRRSSTRELTYADIRRQLIRTPLAHLCFVYRPQTAIDVALGDIGYMDGSSFVKVANIEDDVTFDTILNGNVDFVRSAPPGVETERLGDDAVKHTFHSPVYCNIVRQGKSKHIKDILGVWPHYIRRAPEIAAGIVGLRAEDLILVANIQKEWRGTRLQCKPEENLDPTKPFTVDFIEPLELPEGREWGTWVVAGVEIKDPLRKLESKWTLMETGHCIEMKVARYAQRIEFMQLSRSDYAHIESVSN
ncbi:hypothetical protein FRB96_009482 [Tulasnella sp. 330]|nr:hypothetical protein FRB96_009482 [Tulasnella sp. 330]